MRLLPAWLVTTTLLAAIDFVWLGIVARDHYRRQLGHLLADDANVPAAIALYLVLAGGAFVFAVIPAIERGSATHALALGAAVGCFAYAVYDLTNLAVLRDWPLTTSLLDIAWGTALVATTSWLGFHIARLLGAAGGG